MQSEHASEIQCYPQDTKHTTPAKNYPAKDTKQGDQKTLASTVIQCVQQELTSSNNTPSSDNTTNHPLHSKHNVQAQHHHPTPTHL